MLPYPIYFVHHDLGRWAGLEEADPPPDPLTLRGRFADGWDCWTIQPYLHLKRRGWDVRLGWGLEPGAINVMHADTFVLRGPNHAAFTFVIRPDRPPVLGADVVAVQNPTLAGSNRSVPHHFLPLFPEAGLIPRDPARGARFERIAFLGRRRHLAPAFQSPQFARAMSHVGVEFIIREGRWWDYRDLDAVLAVRDAPSAVLATKPATKLYNAWLAGCIPLLGPEPAYSALHHSDLDYVPVRSPHEVLAAVRQLQGDPTRLAAMRQNAVERSVGFTTECVVDRWEQLLQGPVAEAFEQWRHRGFATALPRRLRLAWAVRRRRSAWDAWNLRHDQIDVSDVRGRWSLTYLLRSSGLTGARAALPSDLPPQPASTIEQPDGEVVGAGSL